MSPSENRREVVITAVAALGAEEDAVAALYVQRQLEPVDLRAVRCLASVVARIEILH